MTWYLYRPQAAMNLTGAPVATGAGQVYAVADTTFATPLTARNPITLVVMPTVAIAGYLTVAFEVEDHEEVYWKAGAAPAVSLISAQGMRDATLAAKALAQSAADSAAGSAITVAVEVSQAESARDLAVVARTATETARDAAVAANATIESTIAAWATNTTDAAVASNVATAGTTTRAALLDSFALAAGLRWIPVGDSLTSTAGGGSPSMGWTVQSSMLSAGQLSEYRNAGVVGNNASDILTRLQADVLSYSPNLVTLWVGTNDITQARTLAAYKADVTAIIGAIKDAGSVPVLFTIPPRADTTKRDTINAWNMWLRTFAETERISLIDAYAALADPATGTYKTGFDSGDGIHATQAAHNAVAAALVAVMSTRLPAGGLLRPRSNLDGNNLVVNGLLLDNDDASPSIPDGWLRAGGTVGVTETIEDDADFHGGKAWQVACVNPTSAPQFLQNCGTAWAVGDVLLFVCRVKVVSQTGVGATKGLRVNANFFGAGSPTQTIMQYTRLAGLAGLVSKKCTVPAGTTGPVQIAFIFDVDTTASATFRVGEAAVYNLTQLGLV